MANTAEIRIPEMTESFEELLNEQFGNKGIVGSVIKGTVIRVTDDFATVDVGLKSEGRIPLREFGRNDELKVGDVVEVLVDRYEDKDGNIVLSREKARREAERELLAREAKEAEVLESKEEPYDIYDETVTKDELYDALMDVKNKHDSSKLKILMRQEELNREKASARKAESEEIRKSSSRVVENAQDEFWG